MTCIWGRGFGFRRPPHARQRVAWPLEAASSVKWCRCIVRPTKVGSVVTKGALARSGSAAAAGRRPFCMRHRAIRAVQIHGHLSRREDTIAMQCDGGAPFRGQHRSPREGPKTPEGSDGGTCRGIGAHWRGRFLRRGQGLRRLMALWTAMCGERRWAQSFFAVPTHAVALRRVAARGLPAQRPRGQFAQGGTSTLSRDGGAYSIWRPRAPVDFGPIGLPSARWAWRSRWRVGIGRFSRAHVVCALFERPSEFRYSLRRARGIRGF